MLRKRQEKSDGTTLMEIMIVIIIIVILAMAIGLNYSALRAKIRVAQDIMQMQALIQSINLYEAETGTFPNTPSNDYLSGSTTPQTFFGSYEWMYPETTFPTVPNYGWPSDPTNEGYIYVRYDQIPYSHDHTYAISDYSAIPKGLVKDLPVVKVVWNPSTGFYNISFSGKCGDLAQSTVILIYWYPTTLACGNYSQV